MKNIVEFINENINTKEIIETRKVNVSWEDYGKNIASRWKSIPDDLKNKMMDDVYNEVEDFYKNTPKKRNVSSIVSLNVDMNIINIEDSQCKRLVSVYKKYGLDVWFPGHSEQIYSGWISGLSYSRDAMTDRNKVQIKEYFFRDWRPRGKEMGNGYNHIPGELMTEYREKFLNCISSAEIVTMKDKSYNYKASTDVPRYRVVYNAIFDKSKVDKLIKDIESDQEMNNYMNSYKNTSKGINTYYASKRSGEYAGD